MMKILIMSVILLILSNCSATKLERYCGDHRTMQWCGRPSPGDSGIQFWPCCYDRDLEYEVKDETF